jgi:hypothetical protein
MPPDRASPVDPEDILTASRLGNAIAALADPSHSSTDPVFHLDKDERETIRQAVGESGHHLTGFAHGVLEQWDDLADEDRVAGLLLFAEVVKGTRRERGLIRGPGVER